MLKDEFMAAPIGWRNPITWSDARFPAQNVLDPTLVSFARRATPDTIFTIANGLGAGSDPNSLH